MNFTRDEEHELEKLRGVHATRALTEEEQSRLDFLEEKHSVFIRDGLEKLHLMASAATPTPSNYWGLSTAHQYLSGGVASSRAYYNKNKLPCCLAVYSLSVVGMVGLTLFTAPGAEPAKEKETHQTWMWIFQLSCYTLLVLLGASWWLRLGRNVLTVKKIMLAGAALSAVDGLLWLKVSNGKLVGIEALFFGLNMIVCAECLGFYYLHRK
ncbi:hypothetical protein ADEAN_000311400 [Angomonas deanei]|uniref:Uncharacterized protein n=1 Tax=Angomonas deanei TaxID=59799 RepID=A0A7G2C7U7_9TRYP|nr:hypothetical protein ADEAN_000311400 [Angomonas deanei]